MIKILPSILTANMLNLKSDIERFEKMGITEIHMDVMDGNFVDAITFGPKLINDINAEFGNIKQDVHLMIKNPKKHVKAFVNAGSYRITIHIEECTGRDILAIKSILLEKNVLLGVAINPETSIKKLKKILKEIDMVLIMSVNPGKGGQAFKEDVLLKIDELKRIKEEHNYNFSIQVDGGVNKEVLKKLKKLGIDSVVIGSSLYKDGNLEENYEDILR